MTDRELMQQALEALKFGLHVGFDESSESQIKKGGKAFDQHSKAITALRERLAQPEQEPVANIRTWHKNGERHAELWNWDKGIETLPDGNYDLYTAKPQRKPLTDEEIDDLSRTMVKGRRSANWLCRAIEAAHGIKGQA